MKPPIELAVFDLDGTLIRGLTLCEVVAEPIGQLARMRALEEILRGDSEAALAAGEEIAEWYGGHDRIALCEPLRTLEFAAGAEQGIALLREAGVRVGIASVTWSFGVAVLAERLGVDVYAGTDLLDDGSIRFFGPEHKADWLRHQARELGFSLDRVAAVGDSRGDRFMLEAAGLAYYVGEDPPDNLNVLHRPHGDILQIAHEILAAGSETEHERAFGVDALARQASAEPLSAGPEPTPVRGAAGQR